ncbi:MAG TPA: PEP-CTERM sorting domain-containing protein [Candidatus Angelobacter sp.]|nr:PEP-CTERM sorting domain-containing protein [Candidatus Angelobacter sp.]
MKMKTLVPLTIVLAAGLSQSPAQTTFNGNGSTAWNGAIGNAQLTLSDNGTTVSGSLTTGGGLSGNAFVLYLQSGSGGFSSTSGFNDNGDSLRSAISQYGGAGEQSTLNFSPGFAPNYAIGLQPGSGINFGGIWQLENGGANSQNFINSINLSPTGSDAQGTYTFSFNLADIGLTPGAGQSFELFGQQVSTTGYSSPEALGGSLTGTSGWGNAQTETSFSTYNTSPVPEPSSAALWMLSGLAGVIFIMRRRSA